MSDKIICPNCGYANSTNRATCKNCREDLQLLLRQAYQEVVTEKSPQNHTGPKWEYCVVGPIKENFSGYYPVITFFKEDLSQERIKDDRAKTGRTETEILAETITLLGEEGWELVGCGSMGGETTRTHLLYFKRPKIIER